MRGRDLAQRISRSRYHIGKHARVLVHRLRWQWPVAKPAGHPDDAPVHGFGSLQPSPPAPPYDQQCQQDHENDHSRKQHQARTAVGGFGGGRAGTAVPWRHLRDRRRDGARRRRQRGPGSRRRPARRKHRRLTHRAPGRIERNPTEAREIDFAPGVALLPGHVYRATRLLDGPRQLPLDVAGGEPFHPHQHCHGRGVLLAETPLERGEAIDRSH